MTVHAPRPCSTRFGTTPPPCLPRCGRWGPPCSPPTVIRSISPCINHRHPSRCQEWRTFVMDCDTQLSSARALVLAWSGEPVDVGCDRVYRAVWRERGVEPSIVPFSYTIEMCLEAGRACEELGLGTYVIVEEP